MSYYRGTAVTEAIRDRLKLITLDNGYRTNIGRNVHVGKPHGTPTDVPCLFLLPTRELEAKQYGVAHRERTYAITGFARARETVISGHGAGFADEWIVIDAIIADVCEALEAGAAFSDALIEHLAYDGAEPAYGEDGGDVTGVELNYAVRFSIAKGDPDNPAT